MKKILFFTVQFLVATFVNGQVKQMPAYPLITHDPYFSIWSFSDKLNSSVTQQFKPKMNTIKINYNRPAMNYYRQAPPVPSAPSMEDYRPAPSAPPMEDYMPAPSAPPANYSTTSEII